MYALIDCNNFYASCERVFRPDLNGKPVVVLSNNDGCVIARSNEAKDLGIPMAAPAFQYKETFAKNNVAVFSANFALYGDMSMRVMSILTSFCPEIEIYSIDEAFLNFDGFQLFDLQKHGAEISRTVRKSTGIPVSVGFAPTKSLAKVANRIAKKFPKETKGVYVIDTEEKRIKALKWLKIGDIWGIGRRLSKRLIEMNVNTAYQFTQLTDAFVEKNFSIVELRLKRDLSGIPSISMETRQDKKSIATTRTFEHEYRTFEEVKERIVTFAVTCAEKLRRQKALCQSMMIFIRANRFGGDKDHSKSIVIKLPFATNSNIDLAQYATIGLEKMFEDGHAYKKAGVVIMDFCPENEVQQTLFDSPNPKHKALMKAVDKLNFHLGDHKIKLGSQDAGRMWKMHQDHLSPRYTTKFSDIMIINAQEKASDNKTTEDQA